MSNEKYKILIVEDSQQHLDVLCRILGDEYTLYVTLSGEDALEKAVSERPDLILLDIIMPGMDGFDVMAELKKKEITRMIPVIFLTGMKEVESEVKGLSMGAVDYIVKPFNEVIVKVRVDTHIKNAAQMRVNERLMLMLDTSPICCQLWDSDFNKIDCNEAAVRLFGYESKEALLACGKELFTDYQPDGSRSAERAGEYFGQVLSEGGPIMFDWTYKLYDGSVMPAEVVLIRVDNGEGYAVAGYSRDMREHIKMMDGIFAATHKLEAAMRETQEANRIKNNSLKALESILNSIDAAIYATVPETGELLFVNTWLRKLYKIGDDEVIGKYCFNIFRHGEEKCNYCPCNQLDREPNKTIVWDDYIAETGMHIRHADCYINWPDGRKAHLQHAVDITALVVAMEKAEHSSRAKSEFLSRMSHEMRTPMNAIIGMTQMLNAYQLPPEIQGPVDGINESSHHLMRLIGDALDVSDMEYGIFRLASTPFNVKESLASLVQTLNHKMVEKHHTFALDIAPNVPDTLVGDEKRLRQVVSNLLTNAIKFTPENGDIHLAIGVRDESRDKLTVEITVTDNGIGIPKDKQPRLFVLFEQTDGSTVREHEGIGLGLALSKRIADIMGGEISVESEPGKGAKFVFICKFKKDGVEEEKPAAGAAPVFCEPSAKSGTLTPDEAGPQDETPDMSSQYPAMDAGLSGRVVLVVDDMILNRLMVRNLLEQADMRMIEAESGQEALDIYQKESKNIDLILMDIRMPGMDGYETTRKIRASGLQGAGDVPILALTAHTRKEDMEAAKDAGMNYHLGKPIDPQTVINALRFYLL